MFRTNFRADVIFLQVVLAPANRSRPVLSGRCKNFLLRITRLENFCGHFMDF